MGFVWGGVSGSQFDWAKIERGELWWVVCLVSLCSLSLISVTSTVPMPLTAFPLSPPLPPWVFAQIFVLWFPVWCHFRSKKEKSGHLPACPRGTATAKMWNSKILHLIFLMHQYAQLNFRKVKSRCIWKYKGVGFVWDQVVHLIWFQLLITFSFFNLRLWAL